MTRLPFDYATQPKAENATYFPDGEMSVTEISSSATREERRRGKEIVSGLGKIALYGRTLSQIEFRPLWGIGELIIENC